MMSGRVTQKSIVAHPSRSAVAAESSLKRSARRSAVSIGGVAASTTEAYCASAIGANNTRAAHQTITGVATSFTTAAERISLRGTRLRHGIVMPRTKSVTGIVA